MQTKQEKSSLYNMTFEKSYQQNCPHEGALHFSAYLSSHSMKELLECMIRILSISHCPDSHWSYKITVIQRKTFLLTTTTSIVNSSILSFVSGHTIFRIVYHSLDKNTYGWKSWSFTARTAGCSDRDCLPTTLVWLILRKHWSTLPFLRPSSGLPSIKKLTWNTITQRMSSVSVQSEKYLQLLC